MNLFRLTDCNSTNQKFNKRALLLVALVLGCFAILPMAQAQLDPPPDGFYDGQNTAEGQDALFSLASGNANTAIGFEALHSNTDGGFNTAIGDAALLNNTTGIENTATGVSALLSNKTGFENTANGVGALNDNTEGFLNTAIGWTALFSNTTGNRNTATGEEALFSNTTGGANTATGDSALFHNTTGFQNTAIGSSALLHNTTGIANVAIGFEALLGNTTGGFNTAIGAELTLSKNTTGGANTAIGSGALFMNTTGNNNIALGVQAGDVPTIGSNNIDIGNRGVAGDSATIRIGTQGTQTKTFIAGISGTGLGSGVAVRVNANGQLGTVASSARFKKNIKPMDKASEAIHALRPVTFRYKKELDAEGVPQFGLVAEEVEKVNPALVARDAKGEIYTVRYEAVNAMLLNEFLKEHRKVQELEKQVEKLTAGLQKVSAQVEMSRPAPQTVVDNH